MTTYLTDDSVLTIDTAKWLLMVGIFNNSPKRFYPPVPKTGFGSNYIGGLSRKSGPYIHRHWSACASARLDLLSQ